MKKNVLITGGNKGIGLEVTRMFLNFGYNITVVARNYDNFEFNGHPAVNAVEFDLTNTEQIPKLVSDLGPIDILVNNAGVMYALPYNDYPDENIQSMLKLNLEAPVKLIEEVSKSMIENGGGELLTMHRLQGKSDILIFGTASRKQDLSMQQKAFRKSLTERSLLMRLQSVR